MKETELQKAVENISITPEMQNKVLQKALFAAKNKVHKPNYFHALIIGCCVLLLVCVAVVMPYLKKAETIVLSSNNNGLENNGDDLSASLQINELTEVPQLTTQLFALLYDDFVPMTEDELLDYYDVTFSFETLFPQLQEVITVNKARGIYKRENGDVYFDNNQFSFLSADNTQEITVVLAKEHLPWFDINTAYDYPLLKTFYKDIEMTICHYTDARNGDDMYYAEFIYQENGYLVYTRNMTKLDFIKAVDSLLS